MTLPDCGSLLLPKHRFAGWRLGEELYSAGSTLAVSYDDIEFTAQWEAKVVEDPSISVAAWYESEYTTVSISYATTGVSIHYTLDGTEPTTQSPLYTGAFSIAGTTTIKAVAVADDWFDSPVSVTTSTRAPWTPDECLNATGTVFRCGGNADWVRDGKTSHDGAASMRSGVIGDNSESWIETTVRGAVTLTFWWKVSCETYDNGKELYDYARFTVDGKPATADIGGEVDWRMVSITIEGNGRHVLRWSYVKDESDVEDTGADCAWFDEVTWTPDKSTISTEDFAECLRKNITTVDEYDAFFSWAEKIDTPEDEIVTSPVAWLSFALDADALVPEPRYGDLVIDAMQLLPDGKIEVTFSLAGVKVGANATDAHLQTIFAVEGSNSLDSSSFSSENILPTFSPEETGRIKATLEPPPYATATLFLRVKIK